MYALLYTSHHHQPTSSIIIHTGFNKACTNINAARCVDGVFRDLVEQVINNESRVHRGKMVEYYAEKLCVTGMKFQEVDARNIFEGLHFVFVGARRFHISAKALHSALMASTDINEASSKVICESWQQEYLDAKENEAKTSKEGEEEELVPSSISTENEALAIGKLCNLDWRVGVSMSSNSCNDLKAPYVGLSIEVAEMSGEKSRHTIELSMLEFSRLHSSLRDAMKKLELS